MTPVFVKRATRTLLAAALASALLVGVAQAQSYAGTQPVDRIAAVVNEDVILRSELTAPSAISAASTPARRTSCRRPTCSNGRCWSGWC